ncbi:MAG TPA: MFS transporter [Planctomycetota bacterium]|nr:MFS transporter [Planctomycetota bacterium]
MSMESGGLVAADEQDGNKRLLFWGCFFALVATAFGFVVRTQVIKNWGSEFGLTETQKGEIFGVGLWPFAPSIVLFSLVIDQIGYGKAMVFAFFCHVTSAILTVFAKGYDSLYWATFLMAIGNGTVEAVINPVVATMYPHAKTKWLSILHAGWPGGLVLGGILAIALGDDSGWKIKVGLIFIPTVLYALLLIGRHFPVQERVKAGVSYKSMLQEAGFVVAALVIFLVVREIGRVFEIPMGFQWAAIGFIALAYAVYVRAIGRWMFIVLTLIMIPLATTELGTDSWITPLMEREMANLEVNPGWVLVYTSLIMMVLRFFAGAIVHRLSPLGLLAVSSLVAAIGLYSLSVTTGVVILVAATIYGFGKTFFWPAMLGLVSEQFPKGGALTLNAVSAVGMLSVGILGLPFLGYIQDNYIDKSLKQDHTVLHDKLVGQEHQSFFGSYSAIDSAKLEAASPDEKATVAGVQEGARKNVLRTATIFPIIMLTCYLLLMGYFRARGGYRPVELPTSGG